MFFIWLVLIVFLAGFVQGLSGFGLALLAVPLLSLLLDIKIVIPLVTLLGIGVGVVNTLRLRRHVNLRRIAPIFLGALAGIPFGVYFLKHLPEALITLPLGVLLSGYALYNLLQLRLNYVPGKRAAYLAGLVSGCLGGAFSTGGPPVVVYAALQDWPAHEKKVLMVVYFLATGCLIASIYALNGLVNREVLDYFAATLPVLLAGTLAGMFGYEKLSQRDYGRVINYLVLLTGLLLAGRALHWL